MIHAKRAGPSMTRLTSRKSWPKGSARASGLSRALLWAMVGPLACFALLTGIILATWGMPVRDETQLSGVLRPVATPIGVDLPKASVLKQIVVLQGEVVRKGQSLAILNEVEMRQRREGLLREVALARIKRHCLTADTSSQFHRSVALLLEGRASQIALRTGALSEDERVARDAAQEVFQEAVRDQGANCTLANAAWEALQDHEAERSDARTNRLKLLSSKISILVERQTLSSLDSAAKSNLAIQALEALLERNALEAAHIEAQARNEASRLERER